MPKFDRFGDYSKSTPVSRARDGSIAELLMKLPVSLFEHVAVGDDLALRRRPGPNARAGGAALKVSVGFLGAHPLDRSFNAHLPLDLLPEEDERCTRVG